MTARPVLLTVSGVIPDNLATEVAAGRRPRADYVVLAEAFYADLLDVGEARRTAGRIGRLADRLGGPHALLAWEVFRRRKRHRVIVTDGEQVGLPYAALCRLTPGKRPEHLMIVHILTVGKKEWLFRVFRLGGRITTMFVYADRQRQLIVERLGVAEERIVLTPFMVDTEFFAPITPADRPARAVIASAGLEHRDYPTLIAAVDGLDARVVLAAASPWSRRRDTSGDAALPANVEVGRLDLASLRDLYGSADIIVVPLFAVDFQAGITTILEAMAMGKAIICTRTPGQTDTIVDGVTGVYVPPGDPAALRAAIDRLLADPDERARLGEAARRWAAEHADIDVYAGRLAAHVIAANE